MERGEISAATWRQYGYRAWQTIADLIEEILTNNPGKKVARFLRKIKNGWKHFKVYLQQIDYPMTNNAAEEPLKSLVITRKLCFGSRSNYERAWRAAIQSCLESLHRQGHSVLDFITDTIQACRHVNAYPNIRS